ncbi:ABC transporter permease [bacterium]|nr:ABC transporter permease [bacterium]
MMTRKEILLVLNFAREIAKAVSIFVFVTLSVFLFIHWMPGSNADEWSLDPGSAARTDQPVFLKYCTWLGKAVQLDFGFSLTHPAKVSTAVFKCFPVTMLFLSVALVIAVLSSLLIGVLWATNESHPFVRFLRFVSYLFSSIPVYILGMVAFVLVFLYIRTNKVNVDYNEFWNIDRVIDQKFPLWIVMYIIPPALLGIGNGNLIELSGGIRSSVRTVLNTEFIKAVRARGASVTRHVARNLLLDVVSLIDARITYLISGAVILENVFNWNGLGKLGVDAAMAFKYSQEYIVDYPLVLAVVFVFTCIVIFSRIMKIFLFYLIDPRIRASTAV